ncbi:MAG: hypothetical protein ACRD19_06290 [Terriglobia bacterium]
MWAVLIVTERRKSIRIVVKGRGFSRAEDFAVAGADLEVCETANGGWGEKTVSFIPFVSKVSMGFDMLDMGWCFSVWQQAAALS